MSRWGEEGGSQKLGGFSFGKSQERRDDGFAMSGRGNRQGRCVAPTALVFAIQRTHWANFWRASGASEGTDLPGEEPGRPGKCNRDAKCAQTTRKVGHYIYDEDPKSPHVTATSGAATKAKRDDGREARRAQGAISGVLQLALFKQCLVVKKKSI